MQIVVESRPNGRDICENEVSRTMATLGRKTVGICYPSGEHVLASFAFLIPTFQKAVSQHFAIRVLPEYVYQLSPEQQTRVLRRFVQDVDVLFVWHPRYPRFLRSLLLAREEHAPNTSVLYVALGEMPLGASWFRPSMHLLRPGDRVLTNCEADRRILQQLVESLCCPVEVFPLWVDTDHFRPDLKDLRESCRADLGLHEEAVLFLYAGRITPEKNVHSILHLFKHLCQEHPDARLILAGPIDNIPFFPHCQEPRDLRSDLAHLLQRNAELASRTLVLAERLGHDCLQGLYAAADVFVNFTLHHSENFGLANVEAMSVGLPLVVSDWGGLRDTVVDNETGYGVHTYQGPLGEHVDLWQARTHCLRLANDRQLRDRMGKAGRAHVERCYALKDLGERLRTLLESTISDDVSAGHTRFSEFGQRYHRTFFSEEQFDLLPRYSDETMELYRTLIRPYCTSEMVESLDDRSRLFLASPFVVERSEDVAVIDPVWPGEREVVAEAEKTLVKILLESGFVTMEEVSGVLSTEAEATVRALLNRGVLVHGRPPAVKVF